MSKPILVVMAAGMGSRYGGMKQIAPVDERGHILMDYALYDAVRAGFERAVFIIKDEIAEDFREIIGDRVSKHMEVQYAFQRLDFLPTGYKVPEGRVKPWGTSHAVLSAKNLIDANFTAINADDFYGEGAYKIIYDFLCNEANDTTHALVGYEVGNTVTEHGHVARGVCKVENGKLIEINERLHIEMCPGGAAFTEDGENFTFIPADTTVSMNFWGFGRSFMDELEARFIPWLDKNIPANPLKGEFLLPQTVNDLLVENKAQIKVLPSKDKWYGVTYANDMPSVQAALKKMREEGIYPEKLLD